MPRKEAVVIIFANGIYVCFTAQSYFALSSDSLKSSA